MHQVVQMPLFLRQIKKWDTRKKTVVRKAVEKMMENPFQPSLRTKKYQSKPWLYESSPNIKIRILWQFGDQGEILLEQVGDHDLL